MRHCHVVASSFEFSREDGNQGLGGENSWVLNVGSNKQTRKPVLSLVKKKIFTAQRWSEAG